MRVSFSLKLLSIEFPKYFMKDKRKIFYFLEASEVWKVGRYDPNPTLI